MIITKQQLEGGTYQIVDVARRDTLMEVGPLTPGMIAGKDGTRVILLDRHGKPEKEPPDPELDRQRSHNWALTFAVVGSLMASAAQALMFMSARADQHVVSHETQADISRILSSPPEDADLPERNAIPRLWVKTE